MNGQARSTPLLVAVCVLAVLASLAWQRLTQQPIADAERHAREQIWLAALPADTYDNQPLQAPLALPSPDLRHSRLLRGYRASLAGRPAAVLLHSESQGYAGPIELAIAISPEGRVLGVQVLHQQESPGLGDQLIDPARHWLQQFVGTRRADLAESGWALTRDHGHFDQMAGATVTSRAVIDATHDALRYFDEHRSTLLPGAP